MKWRYMETYIGRSVKDSVDIKISERNYHKYTWFLVFYSKAKVSAF